MTEYRNFHIGEAQIQAESGVDTKGYDDGVDQMFLPEMNPTEEAFIAERTFSVAASLDVDGRPWASPLIGKTGELFTVENLTTVRVRPRSFEGDPLFENVAAVPSMGILYFNPSTRRRAKSLGHGIVGYDGSITYTMTRLFGICPKYIFKRDHAPDADAAPIPEGRGLTAEISKTLSDQDREQLVSADTIFFASNSEAHGADPTHRGGKPGFVTVLDEATLTIPDYEGNGMFQTLGNLVLDDRIGLLSIDFQTGRILQLTGSGSISAEDDDPKKRVVTIKIHEVRSTYGDIGAWIDVAESPYVHILAWSPA